MSELINNWPETVKKISFAKISGQTLFKMTTRTYTARVLEKVYFTQLFNSIIIKKKFQVCQKKMFQEVCQKESKGGLCM